MTWEALERWASSKAQVTLKDAPKHVHKHGDALEPALKLRQRLPSAQRRAA